MILNIKTIRRTLNVKLSCETCFQSQTDVVYSSTYNLPYCYPDILISINLITLSQLVKGKLKRYGYSIMLIRIKRQS